MTRAIVLVAALGGVAHADRLNRAAQDGQGEAWLHYELTGLHEVDDGAHFATVTDLVLASARLHGFIGAGTTIGYHAGFDLGFGGAVQRDGFAYDVTLFPIGVGVRLSNSSFVALGAGIGAMGATRALDDAVTFPLELTAELGDGRVRLLSRVRASYVAGAPVRHDGAPSIAFADELEAMIGVRVGHHYEDYGYPSGNGYFAGASYRELMGARFVGLTIGYSIDLGSRRRHRSRVPQ